MENQEKAQKLYEEGLKEYENENYEKALKLFWEAAELGHVEAMIYLGEIYRDGKIVEQDGKAAIYWFEKFTDKRFEFDFENETLTYDINAIDGIEKEVLAAMKAMSEMYRDGNGVKQDERESRFWIEEAKKIDSSI